MTFGLINTIIESCLLSLCQIFFLFASLSISLTFFFLPPLISMFPYPYFLFLSSFAKFHVLFLVSFSFTCDLNLTLNACLCTSVFILP